MIEELGGRALAVKCDVTRGEDVKAALDKAVGTFGRLDFAFNNAGSEQPVTPMADLSEDEWDRILRVNLRSVFLCMKYEIQLMLKSGGGAIVNASSGAGVLAIKGQSAYCAAKFGVTSMSKAAALDYAKSNIRINAARARMRRFDAWGPCRMLAAVAAHRLRPRVARAFAWA